MFELERFLRLAKAHWAEYRKGYGWFLASGVMLHAAVVGLNFAGKEGYKTFSTDGQGGFYFAGLFVLGPIFAGRYFQRMADRPSALLALMRPASVFEKWLLAVIVVLLLYPLAYSLLYLLCDIPVWLVAREQAAHELARQLLATPKEEHEELLSSLGPKQFQLYLPFIYDMSWKDALSIGLALVTLQGFAVFGSLYFRSVPFIKTFLVAFVLILAMAFLSSVFESNPDLLFSYWTSEHKLFPAQAALYPLLWFLLPAMLWLACLLALREREIAR